MLFISTHSDTNFANHSLSRLGDGLVKGMLDNFVGVHATMLAYFSGRLNNDYIRIELTYGEEQDFAGALEVSEDVMEDDMVIVVDVTGTESSHDFVIEKCRNKDMQQFLFQALDGLDFGVWDDCPDPIADEDEVDVYTHHTPFTFMLAIPVFGGDYNAGAVFCRERSYNAVAEAICRIAEHYPAFCESHGIDISSPEEEEDDDDYDEDYEDDEELEEDEDEEDDEDEEEEDDLAE